MLNTKFTLWVVVIFFVILRIIPISFGDMYNDSAHYSFRAYGWFDWMGRGGQSTPFEWFGYIPFWARLSFHDAPPLAFLIQNIFFKLFGDSVAVARLPFILAGAGSVLLVYFLTKKITDQITASTAAVLYSFISYGVWIGHSAYLEGVEEFFIVGSILFGGLFLLKNQRTKYLYVWSIFTACALLVKYTAIFLLPPIAIYAYIYRGALKKFQKNVVLAIILFFILISPVIVYNIKMYQLRGHFDAALSSMIGMRPDDFSIISERAPSLNLGQNYTAILSTLSANISYPLLLLSIICFLALLWRMLIKGLDGFESWIICNTFFLSLMFAFGRVSDRYLSIFTPLLVITIALGIKHTTQSLKENKFRYLFTGIVTIAFLFELAYSFNTNVIRKPFGVPGWTYSINKIQNLGFNQLDDFIRKKIITKLPSKNFIKTKDDIAFTENDIEGRSVVIFDDRINWFAQMWYMQKYLLYYRWPVISSSYLSAGQESSMNVRDLLLISGRPVYFAYPISQTVIDSARNEDTNLNSIGPSMAKQLEAASVSATIIYNKDNIPVFKVYEITGL